MAAGTRRARLLTFLLLPLVVLAVGVLATVTFRTSFQLEKLREQSVVEATLSLANEKADRLDKLIVEQDDVVVSDVDVSDPSSLTENWLRGPRRQTPTVRAVLLLHWVPSRPEVVAFASRAPGPDDEEFRRLLLQRMLGDMELQAEPTSELRHLHQTYGETSYLVSYWQRVHSGRRYLVVAWHDVPRIVHQILPRIYSERDEQSRVNVVDAEGRIVFGPPLSDGEFTVGRPFATTLYKWRVNVTLTSAEELAKNVERRRRLEMVMVGLSGLVVIAGIVVVLIAAARERRLSRLKSEFVANVSHELKTPLSLVRMFGELLHSGRVESEEKRRQYLQIIVDESDRLTQLIENVLDFARVERGKLAYRMEPGPVGEVVVHAVETCLARAEREGVELELAVPEGLPTLLRDEGALEVAVVNLVDNALKYAKQGESVRVEVRRATAYVEVRVSDRGPGILPEDRKRIFERFERGRNAQDAKIRGSGIGLALVKHIAEAHGGKAWVEPNQPQGSTFVFTLASRRAEPQEP